MLIRKSIDVPVPAPEGGERKQGLCRLHYQRVGQVAVDHKSFKINLSEEGIQGET